MALEGSGSFSGSFEGDGSGLTGVAAQAGDGIIVTGTTVSVDSGSLAGDGLGVDAGTFKVNVDDSTIETNADALRVKAGGIDTNELAINAVTTDKITDGNVTNAKLDNDSLTIGATEITLGTTATEIAGLTSISATTGSFVLQIFESSSTIITSGSNIFGDTQLDIQQFTGSILQTGSFTTTGTVTADQVSSDKFSGSFSGSFQGDGSGLTGLATVLTVDGDTGTQDVDLIQDDLQIIGTANEIETTVTKVGNDVKVTVGLPQDITVGRDLTVTNNATIAGDLIVDGSIVSASSLAVEDQFIILASGSNGAIDGGIIVNQVDDDPDGRGVAFAYDSSADRWALQSELVDTATTITPDAFMGVIQEGTATPVGGADPVYGGTNGNGTIFVDTNNNEAYIYI